MSFLVGPISGALVAGGVYYGFSTMIQSSTERHRTDLHLLSRRLVDASATVPAPPSASERIHHSQFNTLLKSKWNTQLGNLFDGVRELDEKAVDWTKRVLYGGDVKEDQ
ncbi:hypothetical protein QCA50_016630 [Cerrena zonata]|uniref:MICOS complex subunit MIC12 n=1 Tax=Cerrena zonata TaxID=2478898 RepID=A0AAW0FMZ5_9APHY